MIFTTKNAAEKRQQLRQLVTDGNLHQFPGAFSPFVARMVEEKGFPGVYIGGAMLTSDLGLPDIGLATLSEFADRGEQIARATDLPAIIDIDTGFGEPLAVRRTVRLLEDKGLAGCHIEDQVMPKRCGHLDGKEVVSAEAMRRKITAATEARKDDNFVVVARSDSRAIEGLDASIERMKSYVDAGADMIFPEAMQSHAEFEAVRNAIDAPLFINMTEFGKSPLLSRDELTDLGMNVVIYPVTTWRLACGAIDDGLDHIKAEGDQRALLDRMQDRQTLYGYLQYDRHDAHDKQLYTLEANNEETN